MDELPPILLGFLDGLCVASKVHFPHGGMYVSNFYVGAEVPSLSRTRKSESSERLMEFFVCVLGDTTRQSPGDAEPVVEQFLDTIEAAYPGSKTHFEISETRGWFDCLEVWVFGPREQGYFSLAWSVS